MLIPHKMDFSEGSHVCGKLSGWLASYVTEAELSRLVHHLSSTESREADQCLTDSGSLQVYLGATDSQTEGLWVTLRSKGVLKKFISLNENISNLKWKSPRILSFFTSPEGAAAIPAVGSQQTLQ